MPVPISQIRELLLPGLQELLTKEYQYLKWPVPQGETPVFSLSELEEAQKIIDSLK